MAVSQTLKQLRIGGVPEHFNLPWHLLLESGALENAGLDASWMDYFGGTGAMVRALNEGKVDIAMLLTEGAVAGIAAGGDFKIVSFYTVSPIVWGIHVPASSNLHTVEDLRGHRYAISRLGSGSHLMAFVHAQQQGWDLEKLEFEIVGNLDGARRALGDGSAQIFLWERFMTQPLVDAGEFRRVGDYPTPWSCFAICVSNRKLAQMPDEIETVLSAVYAAATALCEDPQCARLIAARYGLEEPAVREWLKITRWADNASIDPSVIEGVATTLNEVGVCDIDFDPDDFIAQVNR